MKVEIIIGGRGGQGVLFAGHLIGYAAVKYLGKHAVQTQSYGAESRGGESVSEIIIGDSLEDVEQLVVRGADVGIFMYQNALDAYLHKVNEKGILIIDEDLVPRPPLGRFKVVKVPASRMAEELGPRAPPNMVMLGAFSAITRIIDREVMEEALRDLVQGEQLKENLKSLNRGYRYCLKNRLV